MIARHDAVVQRHRELKKNHVSGSVSDAQMQQDHADMIAEYKNLLTAAKK